MGTSIHYSGRASNWDALTQILHTAQLFCGEREWMFALYDDPMGVMDDRDKDDPGYIEYEGPFRGMVIKPHERCEPVRLNFRVSNEMTPASTKTQFAPFEIHAEVIGLLRAIQPFMAELEVMDETELWETGDVAAANEKFEQLGRVIDALGTELREGGLEVEGPDFPFDRGRDDISRPEDEPYG